MSSDAPTTPRPLRADARRNREKIIAAAREAFAEGGLDTQMEDVARRAGVGVGTLYRHFPTKDRLVHALVVDKMERMAAHGREVAARESDDPWETFTAFIRACAAHHETDRALSEVTSTQPASAFAQAAEDTGLVAVVEELLGRAREAGAARPDASGSDVSLMMCGLSSVLRSFGDDAGRRYLELMLAGMRNG